MLLSGVLSRALVFEKRWGKDCCICSFLLDAFYIESSILVRARLGKVGYSRGCRNHG